MSQPALASRADRFVTDRAWFDRPSPQVARDLLGMRLVHSTPEGLTVARIVEVEAYQGPEDLAAHSSHGRTARNAVMFGPPGHIYVYFVYGMHHCMNVVCGPGEKPEAVLIRAAAIEEGLELAQARRGSVPERRLAAGPGNLAKALGIDRTLNGADLLRGPLRLAWGEAPGEVVSRPRIGVDYAGAWATRKLRFFDARSPYVCRVRA
jgi:DNA-3-methyladenine glycosylase